MNSTQLDGGASAVEYALLVAGVVAAVVVVVYLFGEAVHSSYRDSCAKIVNKIEPTSSCP